MAYKTVTTRSLLRDITAGIWVANCTQGRGAIELRIVLMRANVEVVGRDHRLRID
jgi:hypothetical protein